MYHRRFVAAVLILVVSLMAGLPGSSSAQMTGGCQPQPNGTLLCVSGIPSQYMDPVQAFQETQVWCWAASMQMIMNYYGARITQQEIVKNVFGTPQPVVALLPLSLIPQYLNRVYVTDSGHRYQVLSPQMLPVLQAVLPPLQSNRPLLVMTSHHVMVLTALFYYATPYGAPMTTADAVVRDPWPYPYQNYINPANGMINPGRRDLPYREFQDIQGTFMPTVYDNGGP